MATSSGYEAEAGGAVAVAVAVVFAAAEHISVVLAGTLYVFD